MEVRLESAFQNCLWVEHTDRGLCPRRFSPAQQDYYQKVNPDFGRRALCTAGITLDFYTDAEELSLDFEIGAIAIPGHAFVFDVYEDGIFMQSDRWDSERRTGRVTYLRRSKQRSRVTVYLPYMGEAYLRSCQLGDFTPVDKGGRPLWLALGDSITEGMISPFTSVTYAAILERELGLRLVNQGIGGYPFDEFSLDTPLPERPALITVAYGTNDVKRSADLRQTEESICRYMEKLHILYGSSQVFCITPLWRGDLKQPAEEEKLSGIRDAIEHHARERGFGVLHGPELVPNIPEYFRDDRLHPNAAGFEAMARGLQRAFFQSAEKPLLIELLQP